MVIFVNPERMQSEDIVVAWCEEVYLCKRILSSLIITMFERNYAALTIILHTKYITDDVYTVYTICYTSASASKFESELHIT